jgi:hypothetical protein
VSTEPSRAIVLLPDLERMQRNEARYLFLRQGGPGTGLYVADSGKDWRQVAGNELDAAIDDALAPVKP